MDYQVWIARERRYRIKLLRDWPEARDEGIYRVCQTCDEICLCAEATCPNCGSTEIDKMKLGPTHLLDASRIRCKKRYRALFTNDG